MKYLLFFLTTALTIACADQEASKRDLTKVKANPFINSPGESNAEVKSDTSKSPSEEGSTGDSSNIISSELLKLLSGSFVSECKDFSFGAEPEGLIFRSTVDGLKFTSIVELYPTSDCSGEMQAITKTVGTQIIRMTDKANHYEVDTTRTSIEKTALTDAQAAKQNDIALDGFTDWVKGVSKSIDHDPVNYGYVSYIDGELCTYMSYQNDGSTPEKRPVDGVPFLCMTKK